jgi:single-stranded DNA-binding protein
VNRVELIGGLVRKPEYKISAHGTPWMRMQVAVNEAEYDPQSRSQVVSTTFVTVLLWGSQADTLLDAGLDQGDEVYVLGRLDQTEHEGADGKTDRKTRVRATFLLPTRIRGTHHTSRPANEAARGAQQEPSPWGV